MYVCVCVCVCSARFAVQASLDLYSRILNVIERNNYDNFRKRAFTTKLVSNYLFPVCMYMYRIHAYINIHTFMLTIYFVVFLLKIFFFFM